MRELNDYTAELRLRIDRKLEARRQARRRAITTVSTLALVLVIGTAALLPGLLRRAGEQTPDSRSGTNAMDGEALSGETPGTHPESSPVDYRLELWLPGADGQWEQSPAAPEDPNALAALLLAADPAAFTQWEGLTPTDETAPEYDDHRPVRLVLRDQAGNTAEYLFTGTELIRPEQQRHIPLTAEQASAIKALLYGND